MASTKTLISDKVRAGRVPEQAVSGIEAPAVSAAGGMAGGGGIAGTAGRIGGKAPSSFLNQPAAPANALGASAAMPLNGYDQGEAFRNAADLISYGQEKPEYSGRFDQQLDDIYNQIANREKFSYDVNADPLYQSYKDQYIQGGKLAMKDTMGQAAALTGGYGNTYGQQVGQQAYNAYLQNLSAVIPELYGMAYNQYRDQGDDLKDLYGMAGDRANIDYGRYRDQMNDYNANRELVANLENLNYNRRWNEDQRNYERNVYADERDYNRGIYADERDYNRGVYADERDYNRGQQSFSNLIALIKASGYEPTDAELAAAGLTREAATALRDEYLRQVALQQMAAGGSTGGGGGGGSPGGSGGSSSGGRSGGGGYSTGDVVILPEGMSPGDYAELTLQPTLIGEGAGGRGEDSIILPEQGINIVDQDYRDKLAEETVKNALKSREPIDLFAGLGDSSSGEATKGEYSEYLARNGATPEEQYNAVFGEDIKDAAPQEYDWRGIPVDYSPDGAQSEASDSGIAVGGAGNGESLLKKMAKKLAGKFN